MTHPNDPTVSSGLAHIFTLLIDSRDSLNDAIQNMELLPESKEILDMTDESIEIRSRIHGVMNAVLDYYDKVENGRSKVSSHD